MWARNLEQAAALFVAVHHSQSIDVEMIEMHHDSLENYLFTQGEFHDGDHPWVRYIEVRQFHTISGHTEVIEWEDDIEILLPSWEQSQLEDWFNFEGDRTDDQVAVLISKFYDRVCELILEDCPDADIDVALPNNLTSGMTTLGGTLCNEYVVIDGFAPFVERIWEGVIEETHNWDLDSGEEA